MAISGELFGQPKARPGSFTFADGARIAAREYGYLSGNNFVLAPATELFETCFKSDELGPKFPISAYAVRLAAVPHLYFLAFHTGIYLAYAKEILGVDEATMAEIAIGVSRAVDDTRTPKGEPLAKSIKLSLISAGVSLSNAIINDLRQSRAAASGAAPPLASDATRLLLGLVERSFVEGNADNTVLLKGIGIEHAERLRLLDERPARVINALQNDLQLRFAAPQ